jgi:hypothetical protein
MPLADLSLLALQQGDSYCSVELEIVGTLHEVCAKHERWSWETLREEGRGGSTGRLSWVECSLSHFKPAMEDELAALAMAWGRMEARQTAAALDEQTGSAMRAGRVGGRL